MLQEVTVEFVFSAEIREISSERSGEPTWIKEDSPASGSILAAREGYEDSQGVGQSWSEGMAAEGFLESDCLLVGFLRPSKRRPSWPDFSLSHRPW